MAAFYIAATFGFVIRQLMLEMWQHTTGVLAT